MTGSRVDDLADALADRRRFLRALATEPASKSALADRLDVSRSTVDRAVRELEAMSLVAYDGRYRLTPAGRYGLDAHETVRERLDGLAANADALSALSRDAPLDAAFVAGAEVVEAAPRTPDAVVSRLLESVRAADRVEGVAPVALTGHLDAFHDAATAGGTDARILVEHDLYDRLAECARASVRRAVESDDLRLERAEVPFDVGVWLVDDREAGAVVYTDTGVRAVLVNDDPAAAERAREIIAGVAETARPVDAAALDGDA